MNALTALYNSYNTAEKNNLVGKTELIKEKTVLLPIFHTNKRSKGNDIIQITLTKGGEFIKADWVAKDEYIIFPVTENSIARSSGVAAHPLSDEMSYLSKEINLKRHEDYIEQLLGWHDYIEQDNHNDTFISIKNYILKETIYMDVVKGILGDIFFEISDKYIVHYKDNKGKEIKWKLDKIFITFQVENHDPMKENYTVTTDKSLHNNYIAYVQAKNNDREQNVCNISNKSTYCLSKHRGILGSSKLISVSNNDETYYGRFQSGEEITSIGYETSQKAHLMLKYLLENRNNSRKLGNSTYMVSWFSDDIENNQDLQVANSILLDNRDELEDDLDLDTDEISDTNDSFGGQFAKELNDYLSGKEKTISHESMYYVLIIDKISNGRVSIKYFRQIPKSDLIERVGDWYKSTSWTSYNYRLGKMVKQSPSLYQLADYILGKEVKEKERAKIICKNDNLRTKTIERLLPCILDGKRFPLDMVRKMHYNLCSRNSYSTTWNMFVNMGCSVIKKYNMDYIGKKEVNELLDKENLNRNYLYGRLLAVYEKLEQDTLEGSWQKSTNESSSSSDTSKRSTNAERLWTVYTKTPARTLMTLEEKIRPYKERLKKSRPGMYIYYENLSSSIINSLYKTENFQEKKNKPLSEDFIFGYYAQKQDFYTKQNKEEN